MTHRAYVPSGKSDPGALWTVAGASLGAAVLGGLALGAVALVFDLLLLFPICLGAVVGAVAAGFVKRRHVRQPIAVFVIGACAGFVAQSAVHGVAYYHARSTIAEALAADSSAEEFIHENGTSRTVDLVLAGEEGSLPIVGYLRLAAKNGISITHAGTSSSSSPTLTGYGVYALWAIEFLIVCGFAGAVPAGEAKQPFCEACQGWYDMKHVVAQGGGESRVVKQTVSQLTVGQLGDAVRNLGRSDGKSATVLLVRRCSRCADADAVLEVRHVTGIGKKEKNNKVFAMLLQPSEVADLVDATRAPPAAG